MYLNSQTSNLPLSTNNDLNASIASIMSVKSEHLCNIVDEVKSICAELDEIDLTVFEKYIKENQHIPRKPREEVKKIES